MIASNNIATDTPNIVMSDKKTTEKRFMNEIQKHEATIMKVCMSFTNRRSEDIKDLYQDIISNLWVGFEKFRGESSVNTWIYRVSFNTALMAYRKAKHAPQFVDFDEDVYNRLAEEAKDEQTERLYELLDGLNEAEKMLVLLYLDGISQNEIASITGVSEAAVNQKIYRIKKKLVKLYNNEG